MANKFGSAWNSATGDLTPGNTPFWNPTGAGVNARKEALVAADLVLNDYLVTLEHPLGRRITKIGLKWQQTDADGVVTGGGGLDTDASETLTASIYLSDRSDRANDVLLASLTAAQLGVDGETIVLLPDLPSITSSPLGVLSIDWKWTAAAATAVTYGRVFTEVTYI